VKKRGRRLTVNPFVSRAQQQACYAKRDAGEADGWDCDAWSEITPKHLPKKVTSNSARTALKIKLARRSGKSKIRGPTPRQIDPSGTLPLQRQMILRLRAQFAAIAGDIVNLVVKQDAFGLANRKPEEVRIANLPIQNLSLAERIEQAASAIHTEPTPAQTEAGNYRKGRVTIQGIPVVIENPKGSVRVKYDEEGEPKWSREMKSHYGYVSKTLSPHDGDHIDIFVGPHPESHTVFIIHQVKPDGSYDEAKVMLGWGDKDLAIAAYLANYPPNWILGDVEEMSVKEFKRWLADEMPRTTENYSPDQSRDDHGRFSTGGVEASSLVKKVWQTGGFTYNPAKSKSPRSGVIVSLPRDAGWEHPVSDKEFKHHGRKIVREYMEKVRGAIREGEIHDPKAHVGAWHDTETNRVVLDVNQVYNNKSEAKNVGIKREQDAIFDIGTGELIDLRKEATRNAGGDHGGHDGRGAGRSGEPGIRGNDTRNPTGAGGQVDNVEDVPAIRQRNSSNCGAVAAMMVAEKYGVGPDTQEKWETLLDTDPDDGTHPFSIVKVLSNMDLDLQWGQRMSVADLAKQTVSGVPVICPIQSCAPGESPPNCGHYVVVVECSGGEVVFRDPQVDSGVQRMSIREWIKNWIDVDANGREFVRFGIAVGPKILTNAERMAVEGNSGPVYYHCGYPSLVANDVAEELRDDHGRWTAGMSHSVDAPESKWMYSKKFKSDVDSMLLYHGTTEEALKDILKEGLVPLKGKGADATLAESGDTEFIQKQVGDRKVSVYLTTNLALAQQFASLVSQRNHAEPVILQVKIPASKVNRITPDEQIQEEDAEANNPAIKYKGKIPASWIRKITAPSVTHNEGGRTIYVVVMCDGKSELTANKVHIVQYGGKFTVAREGETRPLYGDEAMFDTREGAEGFARWQKLTLVGGCGPGQTEKETGCEPTKNTTENAGQYEFRVDSAKIVAFQKWLKKQLLSRVIGKSQEALWQAYIDRGYKMGAGRAFDDVRGYAKGYAADQSTADFYRGTKEEFLKSSFGQPVSVEKVKLMAGRAFDDLENVTADMSTKMSRVLTDGLVQGKSPHAVAKDMVDQVGLSRVRAETVARTELIRVHASGTLIALKQLGVTEVGVEVEFSTANDELVCEECAAMEGVVMSVDDAEGIIPIHPNDRCVWRPASRLFPPTKNRRYRLPTQNANPEGHNQYTGKSSPTDLTVWHGTTRELLDSINKHGLVPGKSTSTSKYSDKYMVGDRAASVYMSTNPMYAGRYAVERSKLGHSEPVILRIEVPAGRAHELVQDEMQRVKSPDGTMVQDQSSKRFIGTIPPEWIKETLTAKQILDRYLAKNVSSTFVYVVLFADAEPQLPIQNVFCPTGEGGGVDPSCGKGSIAQHPPVKTQFVPGPKDIIPPQKTGVGAAMREMVGDGIETGKPPRNWTKLPQGKDEGIATQLPEDKDFKQGKMFSGMETGGDPVADKMRNTPASGSGEPIGGNHANGTYKETLADGTVGAWKPENEENHGLKRTVNEKFYAREAAASEVAEAIGLSDLVPRTVIREIGGQIGSFQKWADDSTVAGKHDEPFDGEKNLARAAAFDVLIGQTDRHKGNWMLSDEQSLSGDYQMCLIDNGLSFPKKSGEFFSDIVDHAKSDRIPVPSEVAHWNPKKIDEAMKRCDIDEMSRRQTLNRLAMMQRWLQDDERFHDVDREVDDASSSHHSESSWRSHSMSS
jgi:SPP1 gp7 family putative phage head morphogenesis protein